MRGSRPPVSHCLLTTVWLPPSVWLCVHQKAIGDEVAFKYNGYTLQLWGNGGYDTAAAKSDAAEGSTGWRLARACRLPMLRRVCQLTGVQVASKTYNFSELAPFSADVR